MKALLIFVSFFSTFAVFADTYVCSTDEKAKPYDVFTVKYQGPYFSLVQYKRAPYYGHAFVILKKNVPGCAPVPNATYTEYELEIECAGGGATGIFTITNSGGRLQADVFFPEGNIGYPDDTLLQLSCERQ